MFNRVENVLKESIESVYHQVESADDHSHGIGGRIENSSRTDAIKNEVEKSYGNTSSASQAGSNIGIFRREPLW